MSGAGEASAAARAPRTAREPSLLAELLRKGALVFAGYAVALFAAARLGAWEPRDLPLCNALWNAVASVLLVVGLASARARRLRLHRRVMVGAAIASACFLAGYLWYHFGVQRELGPTPFRRRGLTKGLYLALLVSHVVLAVVDLPLVLCTLRHAHREDWARHRRLARWTWPLWFYVSVSGVLVYLALYAWNPPPEAG